MCLSQVDGSNTGNGVLARIVTLQHDRFITMAGAVQMKITGKGVLKTIRKCNFHFPAGPNGGVVVIEFYVCPAQG